MAKKETKAVLDNFKIQSYVDALLEANAGTNQRLSHFLSEYQKVLAEDGVKEFMLYEEFGHGLSNFVSANKAVKKVINEMNTNLATYGKELNTYKLMECICDDAAKCACEDAYTNYLECQDAKSKAILCDACDALEQSGDPVAPQLTIVIANPNAQLEPQQISTFDNESKFTEIQRKIEEDKLRQKVEDAKAEIDAYAEKKYAEMKAQEEAERNANVYDNVVNANGICLGESINNIMNSEAKSNKKLVETLEQYKGALNQGLYEERLYEGFIKNITPFNYLKSVDKEIKRLEKVAEEHQVSINVTKILEEMYTTNSYYILPMIEEDACRFIKNPTDVNCNQLKAALVSFAADPYCRAIMEELEYYNNKPSFLLNDKTMTIKDRAKLIKEHANVSNIYSPVQYIKENECVFNANGQFYVKKGNTLAKLSEEYIPQLSENFIALCRLVNDPHVIMNEDHITLVGNGKIANIFESTIDINGNEESIESVRDLGNMQLKYDFDNNFFIMTSCLAENFNNIANINFGKHIALNENEGLYVDLFNLNGNIFVNAIDESMLNATFYHNVNAIQCRNLINEHMGINVSYLFEELIPSQDKMYLKLNETKNEYEASIAKYEATIEKLKKAKEEDISEDSEKKLDAAIESAQAKVDELKKDYKDWQDNVDKVTNPENNKEKPEDDSTEDNAEDTNNDNTEATDGNTEVEKGNEPIDAEEVDAAKSELSAPLSGNGEEGELNISDDEFDSYLNGNSETAPEGEETGVSAKSGDENGEQPTEEPTDAIPGETPEDTPEDDPFAMINTDEETPEDEPVIEEPTEDEPVVSDEESEVLPEEPLEEPANEPVEDTTTEVTEMPEGYKIAKINFDENLKTGELFRTGNITIMTDMVKSDGTLYTDSKSYSFYIDEETHLPVIEAGEIPVALYNAMVTSIQSDEKFGRADAEGKEKADTPAAEVTSNPEAISTTFDSDEKDFPDYDEVYYDAKTVDNVSDEIQKDDDEGYFDFKDEPDGSLTITAKTEEPEAPAEAPENTEDVIPAAEAPQSVKASELFKGVEDEPDEEDIVTPTYTVDDTVINKPADNIDFNEPGDENPESSEFDDENQFASEKDEKTAEPVKTEEDTMEESLTENNTPVQNTSTAQPQQQQQVQQPVQNTSTAQPQQQQVQQPQQQQQVQQPVQNTSTAKNESVNVNTNGKFTLNEARAAFVKLQAEYVKSEK